MWSKLLPSKLQKRREEKNKPKIAVVKLHGMIAAASKTQRSGLNLETCEKQIDKAFATKNLHSVFLSINSPGGSAVQSELIADYIHLKSKELKTCLWGVNQMETI